MSSGRESRLKSDSYGDKSTASNASEESAAHHHPQLPLAEPQTVQANEEKPKRRITLWGEPGCGKRSICRRWVDYSRRAEESEGANDAIVDSLADPGPSFWMANICWLDNHEEHRLLLMGGYKERPRNIPPRHFQGADVVAFVFDLTDRDSWLALPGWVRTAADLARPRGGLQQLRVLIGNKADLVGDLQTPLISRDEIDRFIGAHGIHEYKGVSAITGEGVRELLECVSSQRQLHPPPPYQQQQPNQPQQQRQQPRPPAPQCIVQ